MNVIANHTAKDYYAAVRHISRRMFADSPSRHIVGMLGGLYGFCLGIAAMFIAQFLGKYSGSNRDLLVWALGAIILGFVSGVTAKYLYGGLAARLLFRPNGYGSGPHRFSIEGSGLVHQCRNSSSQTSWKDIETVEKTKDFIFVYLDRGLAIYIARRSFPDEASYEGFFSALNAKVSDAGA
jgi:hypothetical protein